MNLIKRIIIDPKHLNDKKYIEKIIYDKENHCEKEGYITKINKINEIKFKKFYEQNFSGSILIDVNFNVDIISLDINDIIYCKIIQANEDGIVAQGDNPIFVIIDSDFEKLNFLEKDDIISVKIIECEVSLERNYIKAVGQYLNKENNINTDINNEKEITGS